MNREQKGYFGIGILNTKNKLNIGMLWRSAYSFGASFIFTIGARYKKQSSDTAKTTQYIPLYHYENFEDFYSNMPKDCLLIGIELNERSRDLKDYRHPEKAIYLLGAEDNGLDKNSIEKCHRLVQFQSKECLNVSTAGSIVMYDRQSKREGLKQCLT